MTVIPPASGVTIHNGDTMDVSGGVSVDSTTIETGGLQTVGGSFRRARQPTLSSMAENRTLSLMASPATQPSTRAEFSA